MKKSLAWGLALLLVLGLAGCKIEEQSAPELLEPVGVQMDIAKAKRDTILAVKNYDGTIVPHVEELQFPVDGTVEEINVVLGQKVEKGQVLAALSEKKVLAQIQALEAEISDIQTLGEFSDRQANADIAIAQVELEKMRAEGVSEQRCTVKELQIEKLQLNLEQTQELRQLQIREKNRTLTGLKEKTGENQLVAPCDGRVVYTGIERAGVTVKENATVICIADDSRLYLQTEYIPESTFKNAHAFYVKIGDKDHKVSYIPYDEDEYLTLVLAGKTPVSRFSVETKMGEPEAGQFAVLIIEEKRKENALTVPINAFYQDASGQYVYVIEDGQRVRRVVSVGMKTETLVEITEGLKEGDPVYVKG